jgi:predicted nucleic acid-binding protein
VKTVVDASVTAKWYFPEPGQVSAEALLQECIDGRRELIAPDLLECEFTNVLWKKVRRGECSEETAIEILALWETDQPRLISSTLLARRALELALRFDHPVYDCIYIAAAIEYDAVLATADSQLERLARHVVARVDAIAE